MLDDSKTIYYNQDEQEEHHKPETKWWSFKLEDVYQRLGASENGLDKKDVEKRQVQYGLNELMEKEKFGPLDVLMSQIKSSLVIVLLVAGLITLILGDLVDAGIILLAVLINIVVGFWQEWKTTRALNALQKIIISQAKVLRNGDEKIINTKQLVPGDIVLLSAGDKVPADLRLFKIHDLKINEATLTGESEAREKKNGVLDKKTVLAERSNMAFMGTLVSQGNAHGIVVETGLQTVFGKIAELVSEVKEERTPLQKKLDKFAIFLARLVIGIAMFVFILGMFFGHSLREMFVTSVAVAVSAIPEGLAVVVTVVLTIGMQRILKNKSLVKNLLSAEVLGSASVICADKTGTITEGKMRVVKIVTEDMPLDSSKGVSGISQEYAEQQLFLLKIGMLCNNAYVAEKKEKLAIDNLVGNLTEKALLLAGINSSLDRDDLEKKHPRLDEVPFDSHYKFMMTLHRFDEEHNIIYLKGAPEKVLLFSNYVYSHHIKQHLELNSQRREKFIKFYEDMSKQGLRVLALGYKKIPADINSISDNNLKSDDKLKKENEPKTKQAMAELYTNFVLVGLIGIKDPVRQNVQDVIHSTKTAGISSIMITGDNKFIAKVIGQETGLSVKDENILEGEELDKMSATELKEKVKDIKIYARTTPEQKLKIVKAWQEQGAVVAMTGDGINDAPALKQANIGVALGSATDVAKEAADIILLNNNFKTIVEAVRQGRIIFINIKKIILYYLSDSFTEILIIVCALFFKWPLPILASQIIWVNLIDDTFPALALTREPATHNVMKDKPIKQGQGVIGQENKVLIALISLVGAILVLLTFFIFWQGQVEKFPLANTMAFTLLAVSTLIYVFSLRDLERPFWKTNLLTNKYLIAGVLAGFGLQLLAVYNSFLQKIFQTVPLNMWHWLYVLGMGLVIVFTIEIIKWLFYRKKR
ncbi:cation-translocating P-type ATPase [Patescibacteria group bacterium]